MDFSEVLPEMQIIGSNTRMGETPLYARDPALVLRDGRNRREILVDGAQIAVRHRLIDRPRHDSEDVAWVVRILGRPDDVPELVERQPRGLAALERRDVARYRGPGRKTE